VSIPSAEKALHRILPHESTEQSFDELEGSRNPFGASAIHWIEVKRQLSRSLATPVGPTTPKRATARARKESQKFGENQPEMCGK
jgi:hypothetical protein